MIDLESLLPSALRDVERVAPTADLGASRAELFRRVRRRRHTSEVAFVAAVGIAVVIAGWVNGALVNAPRLVVDGDRIAGFNPLPEPPAELRAQLPAGWFVPIDESLVLLYREGDTYSAFIEGPKQGQQMSCPMALGGKRDCSGPTGSVWTYDASDQTSGIRGSDNFSLAVVPEGAEVLWRGVPTSGSIGIDSPTVCDRIDRFVPQYECVDGEPHRSGWTRRHPVVNGVMRTPRTWSYVHEGDPLRSGTVATVSTSPLAIEGLFQRPELGDDRYGVRPIDVSALSSDDAFVSVINHGGWGPPDTHLRDLSLERFEPSGNAYLGADEFLLRSKNGYLWIYVWIGPEATRSTWAQAHHIVESLRL